MPDKPTAPEETPSVVCADCPTARKGGEGRVTPDGWVCASCADERDVAERVQRPEKFDLVENVESLARTMRML
jgi:hypothetical protein